MKEARNFIHNMKKNGPKRNFKSDIFWVECTTREGPCHQVEWMNGMKNDDDKTPG